MSLFWDWALRAYERPGVAQACLDLQDDHGQCTPYLLWAAWASQSGFALNDVILGQGADLARRFEPAIITPIRIVRRDLKFTFDGVEEGAREALRAQVKALELATEQTLMLSLEALTPKGPSALIPIDAALEQATALWAPPAPKNALLALSQHL
jgi:uncharacterized protein (TIGR02444 family)